MYKLTEQESDGDTMFVFNVDKQGKETYQIKLTKGANGCITQDGINDLKQASKEQQQEEQQVV
jgi:myo-inositol-hexaphosphate 3-phosphohydrolase